MIHTSLRFGFAALAAGMSIGMAHAASGSEHAPGQVKKRNFDPYYNVCRGTSPECYNDWGAFANTPNRVLIYSRTNGPRHASLGTQLAAGLNPPLNPNNVTQAGLIRILAAEGIQADWTEDVTTLTSRINNYKTVIFAGSNRDMLENSAAVATTTSCPSGATCSQDAAKTALRNYMRRGGGFVGIHNAFGGEYNWPYYEGLLGNANFYDHGPNRNGQVNIVAQDPSTAGVPATFPFQDEWYNLMPFPENVKFLATATVASGGTHPGHDGFHPLAWCQYYDGGRAWLTTLGHNAHSYADPAAGGVSAGAFQKLIAQAVKSTMGMTPFCTDERGGRGNGRGRD
jgi:type 1 glutamine amidotransferase